MRDCGVRALLCPGNLVTGGLTGVADSGLVGVGGTCCDGAFGCGGLAAAPERRVGTILDDGGGGSSKASSSRSNSGRLRNTGSSASLGKSIRFEPESKAGASSEERNDSSSPWWLGT